MYAHSSPRGEGQGRAGRGKRKERVLFSRIFSACYWLGQSPAPNANACLSLPPSPSLALAPSLLSLALSPIAAQQSKEGCFASSRIAVVLARREQEQAWRECWLLRCSWLLRPQPPPEQRPCCAHCYFRVAYMTANAFGRCLA